MAKTHEDLIKNISDVLREANGNELARIYNQICSDQVIYLGDSLFEEIGDTAVMLSALENVGYSIGEDSAQPSYVPPLWQWNTPSSACECSLDSKEEAVLDAWKDASQQVVAIRDMRIIDWDILSLVQKAELIEEILVS